MLRFALIFTLMIPAVLQAQEKKAPAVVGLWEGTLDISSVKLRVGFIFDWKDDKLVATLDSIDQAVKVPVKEVTFAEGKLTLDMSDLKAKYEAKLSDDGKTLTGKFTQASIDVTLELKRVTKFSTVNRPQHPKPPYPYDTEDVTVENTEAKLKLGGTLTKPKGDGPFPVLVFITGSGAQDRDESILGHKPFLVIADYLTRQGFATLRCDDRGVGKSTGTFATATSADFATDIAACVEYLKKRKEINPKQIGLIGHSEGGLIAPMVAAKSKDVAFIVLLAGPGIRGDKLLTLQRELIMQKSGAKKEDIARNKQLHDALEPLVQKDATEKEILDGADEMFKKWKESGESEEAIKATRVAITTYLTPWFRYFLKFDPAPTLGQVKCPVLAVNGELDLQVPSKLNLEAIDKAVKAGGNMNVTTKEFLKLNHLFQNCKTGLPNEYGQIEETFAPVALEYIADWLKKQVK